jgi:hypothetical protein
LLDDLRSDRGMDWVPTSGWLTKVAIDAAAPQLSFDLAIDPTGAGRPSRIMAGLDAPGSVGSGTNTAELIRLVIGLTFTIGGIGGILLLIRRRPPLTTA